MKNITDRLENFRNKIDLIDSQILDLLQERQAEIQKVVEHKKSNDIPVRHPAREENMISKLRAQGVKKNLDPEFIEELFRIILRRSRVEQTDSKSERGIRSGGKVLIVGGKGGMGGYFARLFTKSGYETRILERDDWDRVESLCEGIDLALISVPIDVTEEVIEKISPFLPEKAVLADLTSIKKIPLETMLISHKGPVIGFHPLFGPSTSTMDKQIIAAVPGRDTDECRWLMDQFTEWGALIVQSDAEEHDRIMSIVQGLRHFATFVFGRFLFVNKVDLWRTLEFSSPIYRLELGMVGRLFAQDPDLYSGIIFSSPERRKLLKEYLISMAQLVDMVENTDRKDFERQFNEIAEWFGPFSEQALRESSFLIEKLIERF